MKPGAPDPMQLTFVHLSPVLSFIDSCNSPPQAIQGHVANLV
jgi:hypothetical protein